MDTEQKLNILAESSKYDLACSCKHKEEPGRVRGEAGRWIYPAALPNGKKMFLLKTLQANTCINDCSYCPFNKYHDGQRCVLGSDELAGMFMRLHEGGLVDGLFLSSGVTRSADETMRSMLDTVAILRKRYRFGGFVHLKVIPGASDAAIDEAVRMATRVSINMEAPGEQYLAKLSREKKFHEHIVRAMKRINMARHELPKRDTCGQTTQFVVGAAGESDKAIVLTADKLYRQMEMGRIYYSAYQAPAEKMGTGGGEVGLFGPMAMEKGKREEAAVFVREHRLYQVDYLFRRYGFRRDEIYFDKGGQLSLETDPKTLWAMKHPEIFPVDVNLADKELLLRVPGIGPISAARILKARRYGRIRSWSDLRKLNVRVGMAGEYVKLPRGSSERKSQEQGVLFEM